MRGAGEETCPHVLLLTPSTSYRSGDFLAAARRLGLRMSVASDAQSALGSAGAPELLQVDFQPPGEGLSQILEYAQRHPVDAVVGTEDVVSLLAASAARALGCPLEVIDGAAEAQLVLAGVEGALGQLPAGALVFDVGGGSTELIRSRGPGLAAQLRSLDLGCVRLTERHIQADPPSPGELRAVSGEVRAKLGGAGGHRPPASRLVGVYLPVMRAPFAAAAVGSGGTRKATGPPS